jgi:hypothetical protein
MIRIKPRISALGQALRMAAHLSNWGDPLNLRRRGGKRVTIVTMFVRGSCVDARRNLSTIPTVGNLRGGSFSFRPNPMGTAVKTRNEYHY